MQLDRSREHAFNRQSCVDAAQHDFGDLIKKLPDLLFALSRDRHLVRKQQLSQWNLVVDEILLQFARVLVGILRLPFVRCLVALPLDESAADGVVLQFIEDIVSRKQLRCHRVGVTEIPLSGIEHDVLERQIETRGTNRKLVDFIGIGC